MDGQRWLTISLWLVVGIDVALHVAIGNAGDVLAAVVIALAILGGYVAWRRVTR